MANYTVSQDGTSADYSVVTHNAATFSAGDIITGVGTLTSTLTPPSSGSAGSHITYRNITIDGGAAINNGMEVTSVSYITIENLNISDCIQRGLSISGGNISNIIVDGAVIDTIPGSADAIGNGVGCTVHNLGVTSLPASNIWFYNVHCSNCGRMGFDTQTTGHHIYWIGCFATECGASYDGGGFYAHPYRVIDTTWTLVSGTIYSTAVLSVNDNVNVVYDPSNSQFLTEVGSTTPANGEFYYDTTLGLRINIGADPNGVQIQYARGPQSDFYWIGCVAWNNRAEPGGTHGSGIQMDDLISDSYMYGCTAHNNEGTGINLFRGQRNTVAGCKVYSNGSASTFLNGIQANQQDTSIIANTLSRNNAGDGISIGNGTCNVYNAVNISNGNYGLEVTGGDMHS